MATRRQKRIWLSLFLSTIGLIALGLVGIWMERRRETDLQNPAAGVTTLLDHEIPAEAPQVEFRDVASAVGIDMRHGPGPRGRMLPEDTGSGLAWGDYDGDGDPDLYVVNFQGPLGAAGTPEASNRLFRNDQAGFVDVTDVAGVGDVDGFGMGATFVDFDGDGDLDLYVTNFGPNRLFRNRGDGTFDEIAAAVGLDEPLWSIASAWGDFDRDGLLDVYVTNYVRFEPEAVRLAEVDDPNWEGVPFSLNPNAFDPEPNRLFRQVSPGRFRDVALEAGASNPEGRSMGAVLLDLDGDGWMDLYVANDVSPNVLLTSLAADLAGEPVFEDRSAETGTADPRGSMGIAVGKLLPSESELAELPDLFITHWVAQENALYQARPGPRGVLEYHDKARNAHIGELSLQAVGWGCGVTDLDLDGRGDLVVANGSTLEDRNVPEALIPQPLQILWNSGDRFFDLTPAAGGDAAAKRVARGLAIADYDGDGDPDLALSVNRGRLVLLENRSPALGMSLGVRLRGSPALRTGSRLTLLHEDRAQVRWWAGDPSYASGHDPEVRFGLGRNGAAEALTVRWTTGAGTRVLRPPSGYTLVIERRGRV